MLNDWSSGIKTQFIDGRLSAPSICLWASDAAAVVALLSLPPSWTTTMIEEELKRDDLW